MSARYPVEVQFTTVRVKNWEAGDFPSTRRSVGRRRGCAWGGQDTCPERAEFTLEGAHRVRWAACRTHLASFVSNEIRNAESRLGAQPGRAS